MGKLNKEQISYMAGMNYALELVKKGGVEELEKEIRFRGAAGVCMQLTRKEAIALARDVYKQELAYIAAGVAWGLKELHLPPSITIEFLRTFNDKVAEFRDNHDEFLRITELLGKDTAMNQAVKNFMKEDKE